ncbi:MAG: rane protein [Candidatus Eremiobacteraeota bacterium]|nr:rane protein [Candidatus Eremiobacteraeota bacterium]
MGLLSGLRASYDKRAMATPFVPVRPAPKKKVPGSTVALIAVLLAGLALRAALIPLPGRVGDIRTYMGWFDILRRYGTHGLYQHVEPVSGYVINYPPVYPIILAITARVYTALPSPFQNHDVLVALLKAPAIVADIAMAALAYAIVLRWKSRKEALAAAAIAAFGPWTWLISAVWGQVDAVSALFLMIALAFAVRERFTLAWSFLAIAILLKPFPLVVAPLLLVWQIERQGASPRLAFGPLSSFAIAYVTSLPFAPTANPLGVFHWLVTIVQGGHALFPFTSVSALNVYTIAGRFWVPDAGSVFGLPLRDWGFVALTALIASITVVLAQRSTLRSPGEREQAFVASAFLVLAATYMVLTRMHERYLFPALALAPLTWFVAGVPRLVLAAMLATFTMSCVFGLTGTLNGYWHGLGLLIAAMSSVNVAGFAVLLSSYVTTSKRVASTNLGPVA